MEVPAEAKDPAIELNAWLQTNFSAVSESFVQSHPDLEVADAVNEVYTNAENTTLWNNAKAPNQAAKDVLGLLQKAQAFGLDSSYYQLRELHELEKNIRMAEGGDPLNKALLEFDYLLTHEALVFMSHLRHGVLYEDTAVNAGTNYACVSTEMVPLFTEGIASNTLREAILKAQPQFYEYHRLQQSLAQFLEVYPLSMDTIYISNPKKDSAKVAEQTKVALIAHGFLTEPDALVDSIYVSSLKEFQNFCGLETDGKVGSNTRKALMVNNFKRYQQASVSLQRLRWEADTSESYGYINIPEYTFKLVENNVPVKEFRVVVGASYTPTPTLTSRMTHFITSPNWYVPYSISSGEILPKAKKDSTYLARNGYQVFSGRDRVASTGVDWSKVQSGQYKIRQSSGRGNALGKVKFIFKNEHSVYIHDTNLKRFFAKDVRAYSHGCMRLQNPEDFADYLVMRESHKVTVDSLDSIFKRRTRKVVNLQKPLDIKVRYVTTVGHKGALPTFHLDVYKKDVPYSEALLSNSASAVRRARPDDSLLLSA